MVTNNSSNIATGATSTVLTGQGVGSSPTFSATPTVTSITFGSGTALNTYTGPTSWKPVVAFGGSSSGITYTTQSGSYSQIGNIVFFTCLVTLSSKGAQTGTATLGGFPSSPAGVTTVPIGRFDNITFTGALCVEALATSSTLTFIQSASGGGASVLNNTNFTNTSEFSITGFYSTS